MRPMLFALAALAVACSSHAPSLSADVARGTTDLAASAHRSLAATDAPAPMAAGATSCRFDQFDGGGRCYADADSACIAQGCDHCDELETAPVQVVCMD